MDGTTTVLSTEEFAELYPDIYDSIVGVDQPETPPTAGPVVDVEDLDVSNTTDFDEAIFEDTNTTDATEPPSTFGPGPSTIKGGGKREIKPLGSATHFRDNGASSDVPEGRTETSSKTNPRTVPPRERIRQRTSDAFDQYGGAASF